MALFRRRILGQSPAARVLPAPLFYCRTESKPMRLSGLPNPNTKSQRLSPALCEPLQCLHLGVFQWPLTLIQRTREGCGCFRGLFGGPGKIAGNFSRIANATNSRISDFGKGKPAGNLGSTLPGTLSQPSVRGCFFEIDSYSLLEFSDECFCKSIAMRMGAASWYKLVVYMLLLSRGGHTLAKVSR